MPDPAEHSPSRPVVVVFPRQNAVVVVVEVGDGRGCRQLGVETTTPIFTRGILIDIAGLKGRMLERSEEISVDDIKAALLASRRAFVAAGIFSLVLNMLMLAGPLYMMQVFDRVISIDINPENIARFKSFHTPDPQRDIIVHGSSRDMGIVNQVQQMARGSDLLFIDGGHLFDEVRAD